MRAKHSSYDVVIAGGGPVGTVTAVAHARQGARVLVLEADPRAARRFAGEWLHPTGVAVLDQLRIGRIERARPRTGYGFVILPDDGSPIIELPYVNGVALSAEHGEIVEALREVARDIPEIDYLTDARVVGVEGGLVRVEERRTGATFEVRAGRVIGADGRRSIVRQSLGLDPSSAPLSHMASVELRGVTMPREGFGHVILGGPGPALFYRISDDVVRGCLDIPLSLGPRARTRDFLWDGFAPVLPESLRAAFYNALERGPGPWAVNRFRPRTEFGRVIDGAEVALVGDALGHLHPMTAMGLTMGFLDACALAGARDLSSYAEERRGYIPELLSNALYHCFRRDDPSATEVRQAIFRTLRADARERRRTMEILSGADPRRRTFGSAFLRMAAQAIGHTVAHTTSKGRLGELPGALLAFGEWMQWPAALVVPSALDPLVRAKSSSTHPIPQLTSILSSAAPLEAPEEEPRPRGVDEVPLTSAIERGCALLHEELERIAARVGSVPDAVLAGPALSCMRAILATRMNVGMAARMTLGRRRLAVDGFPRLLVGREPECRHLAELMLVLLDGASWQQLPIAALAEGVRALVDCQTASGAFAETREDARRGVGSLELTRFACRALDAVSRSRPGATDVDLDRVLERAGEWVKATQKTDGSWPASMASDSVAATALALDVLLAVNPHPGEPAARRAVRWLGARALPAGGFAPEGGCYSRTSSAQALGALARAGGTQHEAIVATAKRLATEIEEVSWEEAREIVEALAACEARRARRPRRVRKTRPSDPRGESHVPAALAEDWAFCKESLGLVSRTFARPIALLPPRLEVAVTLGYLLCRIADTIEDHTAVDGPSRDTLFRLFLEVLEADGDPQAFADAFASLVHGNDAELDLARSLPRVMRIFASQDAAIRSASVRWVTEMARGMTLYAHRAPGDDGVAALHTTSDLERYCYYVAGTVGHLLTDLFAHEMGMELESPTAIVLRDRAEGFATGLQLTNILKDVTDDFARGASFIPRTECARQGFSVAHLLEPSVRKQAHAAAAPIFDLARSRLDEGLEYSLAIPAEHPQIRLFCLLPLWMAARTLVLARGNDAMFVPNAPVKITRAEVEALIAECVRLVSDDAALRVRYASLFEMPSQLSSQVI